MALALLLLLAAPLRFDLAPGDHLVYRQRMQRETTSERLELVTETEWTNHVLVAAGRDGISIVGFERDRAAVRLSRYRESGKDRLAREQPAFDARMAARPRAFVEVNRIDASGRARLPWAAVREGGGELLQFVHETFPLPEQPPTIGAAWTGGDDLGLAYRLVAADGAHQRIEAKAQGGAVVLRIVFDAARGIVESIDMDGSYSQPPDRSVHETLRLELVERMRGDDIASWLTRPDTRQGALALLMVADSASSLTPAVLAGLLEAGDVAVARQALAVVNRHRLPAPPVETLAPALRSDDPRLRALAVRALERAPSERAGPLLEQAAHDRDPFVVRAAAATARHAGPALPAVCDAPDRADRALWARRLPGQLTGTTLRHMTTPAFDGWPYLVRVPEDYRGDEPFPLLVVLAGGPGRAMTAALGASDVVAPTGYVVVYPDAHGMWWEPRPTAMLEALLKELLATVDVDTNRVYLTGFSNGGTGTFLLATRDTGRFAAAVSMMGGGAPFFQTEPPALANLVQLPMLFLHGKSDTVIPVDATLQTVKALKAAGAPVESQIFEGRGHDITLADDGGLSLPFFAAHVREPFPHRLHLETRSLDTARDRWLEIVAKDGGMAAVDATIDGDEVRVTTRRVKRLRLLLRRELLAGSGRLRVVIDGKQAFDGPFAEDCRLLDDTGRAALDPYLGHSLALELDVPR